MDFTEIIITVKTDDVDTASAIANMAVPYGIYIEDYSNLEQQAMEIAHIDLIDENLLKKDRDKALIHIYIDIKDSPTEAIAYLEECFTKQGIPFSIDIDKVKEQDWRDNWKKYFKPLEIGKRLAVCPSWEKYDNKDNRRILSIDPGAAFGTGAHDTTRLCLSMLEGYCGKGKAVLDIGCGSGILALSALILGCDNAVGVDIDPLAVKVACENARINGLSESSRFLCGDLVDKVSGKYDIICANIVADVIITLCDSITEYIKEDGVVVFSGIIDSREDDVVNKIESSGLTVSQRLSNGGWIALACKKV